MSKGAGRIERAIVEAFVAEPDNAFTVEDLCDCVYRGVNRVEKKHRVAVLRAMKKMASNGHDVGWLRSAGWNAHPVQLEQPGILCDGSY
jgi:hypothetical protein